MSKPGICSSKYVKTSTFSRQNHVHRNGCGPCQWLHWCDRDPGFTTRASQGTALGHIPGPADLATSLDCTFACLPHMAMAALNSMPLKTG